MKETNKQLLPKRCILQEAARNLWVVFVEQGTKREELKRPEFWSLVARTFKIGDRIEVQCDDSSYFAEYLVRSVGPTHAVVYELSFRTLDEPTEELGAEATNAVSRKYSVQFRGPLLKHCVEYDEGGGRVKRFKERINTKAEAEVELNNLLKSLGVNQLAA